MLVETTGLADPAPVLNTLLTEPVVQHHFEPGAVIATVDALNGTGSSTARTSRSSRCSSPTASSSRRPTSPSGAPSTRLEERLRGLNPAADLLEASFGDADPALLLAPGNLDPRGSGSPAEPRHADVHPFVLFLDRPVDWTAFGIWLTMLLAEPWSGRPAREGAPRTSARPARSS